MEQKFVITKSQLKKLVQKSDKVMKALPELIDDEAAYEKFQFDLLHALPTAVESAVNGVIAKYNKKYKLDPKDVKGLVKDFVKNTTLSFKF